MTMVVMIIMVIIIIIYHAYDLWDDINDDLYGFMIMTLIDDSDDHHNDDW